jgi:hypothetical protein
MNCNLMGKQVARFMFIRTSAEVRSVLPADTHQCCSDFFITGIKVSYKEGQCPKDLRNVTRLSSLTGFRGFTQSLQTNSGMVY